MTMKDLTESDRMKIAIILNRNAEKRAAFEENVKRAKKMLGEDKIKIVRKTKKENGMEKAFDALSRDHEKAMKELSLEIEKNRKLQIIEEKFDVEVLKIDGLDGKTEYIIDIRPKPNKYSNMSGNSLTKEEYESIKEWLKGE